MPRIYYQGSTGDIIEFDNKKYYLNRATNLLSYEWKYTNSEYVNRIESFDMKFVKKQMNIGILALRDTDFEDACKRINNVFDYDVRTLSPGRLYVGSQYVSCYFVASGLSSIDTSNKKRKNVILKPYTMVCEDGQWLEEINFNFEPEIDEKQLHDRTYKSLVINSADRARRYPKTINIDSNADEKDRIFSCDMLTGIKGSSEKLGYYDGNYTHIILNNGEFDIINAYKNGDYSSCIYGKSYRLGGVKRKFFGLENHEMAISTPLFRVNKTNVYDIGMYSYIVVKSYQEDVNYDYWWKTSGGGATIELYNNKLELIDSVYTDYTHEYVWEAEEYRVSAGSSLSVYDKDGACYARMSIWFNDFETNKPTDIIQEFKDNLHMTNWVEGTLSSQLEIRYRGTPLGQNEIIQKNNGRWIVSKTSGTIYLETTSETSLNTYFSGDYAKNKLTPWKLIGHGVFQLDGRESSAGTYISAFKNKKLVDTFAVTERKTKFPMVFPADCDEFVVNYGNANAEEGIYNSDTALDYIYDFNHDYSSSMINGILTNDTVEKADFIMTIYGPIINPLVSIADNMYGVNVDLADTDKLVVDSVNKTVTKIKLNGEIQNVFSKRNRDGYIFEKIPIGKHSVVRNGLYEMEIDIIKYRSEPEWWT